MADTLNIQNTGIGPLGGASPIGRQAAPAVHPENGTKFSDLLARAQEGRPDAIKFSAHAQTRLQSRHIDLNAADVTRIEGAVKMAASKGARESLVMLDQTAFVVSVPNRTVITVVDKENLKQNVFTNIDSAVIA